jgi:anaerobic selenocysteine-containing dehydrogenase
MDRRNFFKLVGTASGGAVTGACGKQAEEIIPLLVPEEEIVPGVEAWHPSVCHECGAGCGTIARVLASEREIEVDGERVRQRIASIKKLEGNPEDPISGGRLCARGHAALQSLYNPDRLRGPMKRVGSRGEGRFEPVSWDSAIREVGAALTAAVNSHPSKVLFLTQPRANLRTANIARFLNSLGAPPASGIGVGDFAAETEASRRAYGWNGIPVYEIHDSTLVLSIGADFLGGWVSPVLYSRRYGHMRQGRRELRGRLVHAESRFSLTAWNADRWLPVWPGGELALALGIGHVLVHEKLAPALADAPKEVVSAFAETDLEAASSESGIPVAAIRQTATGLARASAPLVLAGASIVRRNSADAVTAASALNLLLGSVGKAGGVIAPSASGTRLENSRPSSAGWVERLAEAALVFVDGVNPAYNLPPSRSALAGAGAVVSFSSFVDDSSAFADWILPDNDALERPAVAIPGASPVPSVRAAAAFVAPLYDSRPTETVLTALAGAAGRPFEALGVEASLTRLHSELDPGEDGADAFVKETLRQGGWNGDRLPGRSLSSPQLGAFRSEAKQDPLVFQAYPSLQFGEGSGANRPWLQELPDPASSAMWGMPVELDPGTAERLGVRNGAVVRVESVHGSLQAPVYVNPAAIPGVVSMALGPGHDNYGRYASGRGANPMTVVGNIRDRTTGATALGPTQVKVSETGGTGRLIQFSRQDRDAAPHRL